jgi:hypothetical protein
MPNRLKRLNRLAALLAQRQAAALRDVGRLASLIASVGEQRVAALEMLEDNHGHVGPMAGWLATRLTILCGRERDLNAERAIALRRLQKGEMRDRRLGELRRKLSEDQLRKSTDSDAGVQVSAQDLGARRQSQARAFGIRSMDRRGFGR